MKSSKCPICGIWMSGLNHTCPKESSQEILVNPEGLAAKFKRMGKPSPDHVKPAASAERRERRKSGRSKDMEIRLLKKQLEDLKEEFIEYVLKNGGIR